MSARNQFLILATVCLGALGAAQAQPGPPPPPEVGILTVAHETLPVAFDFVGVTEASRIVEVRARVRGFLETRDFAEGAFVEAGTRLFSIDPRSFEADRDIAAAQVQQAEARLRLAEQELARLQSVTVPGAVAPSDIDTQTAAQSNAAAALRLARAQLAKADLELGYTRVEAPLSGYIGKALREIGSFVDEGQNSLLAVMQQVDPLYVSFSVSERQYLEWRRAEAEGRLVRGDGDALSVSLRLLDGTTLADVGAIDFESAEVDTATGTIEFRAAFANSTAGMKPGQFVKVLLNGYDRPGTVAIPQRAVGQSTEGAFVYVVNSEDVAELRFVQPGAWSGKRWIIESGLEPGDRVVVEGLVKVQPGLPVRPLPLPADPEPAEG